MVGISFCAWILENVVLSSTAKRQNHLTYKKSRNYGDFFCASKRAANNLSDMLITRGA